MLSTKNREDLFWCFWMKGTGFLRYYCQAGAAMLQAAGQGWRMDEASCHRTHGGAVPEQSPLHHTWKLLLEWPCSPGEKPTCVLPAKPRALAKSGRWWQRLGKALSCCPVLFAELPWGWQVAPVPMSPLPGEAQDRGSDWDLIAQRDWHPSSSRGKAGAQQEAITTGIFSLAQAREAGKHMVSA